MHSAFDRSDNHCEYLKESSSSRGSSQPIFNLHKSWKSVLIVMNRGEIKPRGSCNLATTLSTVRLFKISSLANSTSQSNRKTKVSLSMFQFNRIIFFSLETNAEQLWTPNWVCAYILSSSDSWTTFLTGTPSSSSIYSISLLELDIHSLKLNLASFILDLAFL